MNVQAASARPERSVHRQFISIQKRPRLAGLSLQVTDACNLACSYCYFYEKDPVAITPEIIDRAFDVLTNECDRTVPEWNINLFGGEPTLRPDLIEYICTQATSRAGLLDKTVSFSMTTNGTRFDERFLKLSKRFNIATMLSLDGNEKAHDRFRRFNNGNGSYRKIVDNLNYLKAAPFFKVRLTVSPMTVQYLSESVEELLGLGIRNLATSAVVEETWTEEHFCIFAEQWQRIGAIYVRECLEGKRPSIKGLTSREDREPLEICAAPREFGCGAATTFVFINAFGDIYPCHRYPGYFNKSESVRLGSVHSGIDQEKRLYYITANASAAKRGCSSFVSSTQVRGPCGDCAIQGVCGGSCMAVNEYVTGDPTQPPSTPGRIEQIKLAVLHQVHDYLTGTR